MPRLLNSPPKYRKHKASGQAVVTINGSDHYLGPWNSRASKAEYDRLIGEWLAHGRTIPKAGPDATLTVNELLAAYVRWAKGYYGESSEFDNTRLSLRPVKELYGRTLVVEFGPLKLKAVRERMIADNLCRNEINRPCNSSGRHSEFRIDFANRADLTDTAAGRGLSLGSVSPRAG